VVTAAMLGLVIKCKKMHPIVIICICAVIGIAAGYLGL
jgi:mannose/fructose/N-acetylgalactosamine-specific phosphotransferase system component IID